MPRLLSQRSAIIGQVHQRLLAPFYVGLAVSIVVLLVKFVKEFIHLVPMAWSGDGGNVIVVEHAIPPRAFHGKTVDKFYAVYLHADTIIVDAGGPLGKTKRTDSNGVSDSSNPIGGYIIVQAETHDAAARLFENHPHFAILPGNAVEIMPCNDIPM